MISGSAGSVSVVVENDTDRKPVRLPNGDWTFYVPDSAAPPDLVALAGKPPMDLRERCADKARRAYYGTSLVVELASWEDSLPQTREWWLKTVDPVIEEIMVELNHGIMRFFAYEHLPDDLREASKMFCDLAQRIENELPGCYQKSLALQKLLEAKDCAVRAKMEARVR